MNKLVDIFSNIVQDVRDEWDAANDKRPFYEYGHPIEIFNKLSKKSKSENYKYDKYPLIALYQDFQENNDSGRTTVTGLTIVIITQTDVNFEAPNRYTNTFIPTLLPLYELLMKHIRYSKYVSSDDKYAHTKWDRLYYGKSDEYGNSGNIGNDALDAIVINDLSLNLIECRELFKYRLTEGGKYRLTEGKGKAGNKLLILG